MLRNLFAMVGGCLMPSANLCHILNASVNRICQHGAKPATRVMCLVVLVYGSTPLLTSTAIAQEGNVESLVIPIAKAGGGGETLQVRTLSPGDSGRQQLRTSLAQVPLGKMTAEGRREAQAILNNVSLYRRLPTLQLDADRRVYEFFTNHPDVAVSFWRAMGISRVQMWQTGPDTFETDTQDGTVGIVQVLVRHPQHYVITCSGKFQSPALRNPIQAFALMHLQPQFHNNGTVTHTVDLFVSFPSQAVETIAKIISPVSNLIADRNFEEISLFMEMMSHSMQSRPEWVERFTPRMDGILEGRTDELLRVTSLVHAHQQQRMPLQQHEIPPLNEIPPLEIASPQGTDAVPGRFATR